ncbi:MAG: YitT family protein [Lentimicrobiaceae bacterium]|nr:YitT family protein [Lentimicrobiaceae bacterium]MCO5264449.1 YitT family protein [Lentimicrobium sp.]
MTFLVKEKLFSKKWFISNTLIVVGSFILAAGFVFFINPYNIVPGGVYGIGIVVHHLSRGLFSFWPTGIPIGLFGLLLNIPLTILGIKILGPRFGVKTVLGFVLTSVFMDLLTMVVGEQDPLGLADDILMACVFGGVLIGFGLGLIFKSKATSGGSDIVAMIIAKYTRLPLGQLMIYVDSAIVLLALVVFQDWKIPLYSWIVIFVTGKVIDITMQGVSYDKSLIIISDQFELIRDKIINDLRRGGTYIPGKGMFNNSEKTIIFTVLNRRELAILEEYIHQVDPKAFVTVMDANEILGEGFKSLKEKISE